MALASRAQERQQPETKFNSEERNIRIVSNSLSFCFQTGNAADGISVRVRGRGRGGEGRGGKEVTLNGGKSTSWQVECTDQNKNR